MSERYSRVFTLSENLYCIGSPVIIAAGTLLKDNQTGRVVAQLKLRSISPKAIKAVKVRLHLLDTSGTPIGNPVDFDYLDLSAERDAEFGQKTPIPIPESKARSYEVAVIQVIFGDRTAWNTSNTIWEPLTAPKTLNAILGDAELIKQYKIVAGDNSTYYPIAEKDVWYCACGGVNRVGDCCHICHRTLSALQSIDLEQLRKDRDSRLAEEASTAKAKKRKRIITLFTFLFAFPIISISLFLTIYFAVFESRYNSAVKLLENQQYEEAIVAFQDMKGYRDSDAKFDELLALIDFTDGKEIKLSNDYTMRKFMSGRWEEVKKGQYYFEVCEKEDGGCTIAYNLPHPEGAGTFYFEDGIIWFGDKASSSPGTKSFKISIMGKDTVSIYCYKNDETYELCRVEYEGQQEAKLACEAVDEIFAEAFNPNGSNEPTENSSSGNSHACEECGNNAMNTYNNPFSGKTEYYCNSHYQEILDIMSGFESDVGNSAQSKHTCEQCSREGTHRYDSFTGQTEYYCTEHYEELMDMLEAFGLD